MEDVKFFKKNGIYTGFLMKDGYCFVGFQESPYNITNPYLYPKDKKEICKKNIYDTMLSFYASGFNLYRVDSQILGFVLGIEDDKTYTDEEMIMNIESRYKDCEIYLEEVNKKELEDKENEKRRAY